MNKGDLVLIAFPFTDLSGKKLRPALVLATSTDSLTVAFITSQFKFQEDLDIIIAPNAENGIKKLSLLRISKLATLDKGLAKGIIGVVNEHQLERVDITLKNYFQLL